MIEKLNHQLKIINGGINSPKGFLATGSHIGIKKDKKDLALIYSEVPANVAAVFTTNVVKAAPIMWNIKITQNHNPIQAIIINSGNANACTGEIGIEHTEMMAKTLADCLGLKKEEVMVCSTGIIGVHLPIDIICKGIEKTYKELRETETNANLAAEAIMTTDTYPKQISVEFNINGKTIRIGGMIKGSGMIHPNLATMLSSLTTDINISRKLLEKALKESVFDSYNMISVDGDTSTNDQVTILANGLGGNKEITEENEDYLIFKQALHYVNLYLAQEVVKDGEGASKFITVQVKGAATKEDAKLLSKSVITSNLVKTAFFGQDANWGRIIAALGYSGIKFNPLKVSLKMLNHQEKIYLMKDGVPLKFDEKLALKILKEREILVEVILKEGNAVATAWGCDLSLDYVRINAEYRT